MSERYDGPVGPPTAAFRWFDKGRGGAGRVATHSRLRDAATRHRGQRRGRPVSRQFRHRSRPPRPPCTRRRPESHTSLYVCGRRGSTEAVLALSGRPAHETRTTPVLTVGLLTARNSRWLRRPLRHIPLCDPGLADRHTPLSAACAKRLPAARYLAAPLLPSPCTAWTVAAATFPLCRSVLLGILSAERPAGCYHDVPGEQPDDLFPR